MKTLCHSFCKQAITLALLLLGIQNTQAQEAFYVYRNDGDFNGFFFDQVTRISYSKTDLDGIEHDIYVIQEVETSDSLYRIPLSSIDSVGFVQPEIKFSSRLKNMAGTAANHFAAPPQYAPRRADGQSMSDWVRQKDGQFLYFDLNTPSDYLPEVGDVLVDFYNPQFKRDEFSADEDYSGFSGKVTHCFKNSDYWIVRTDPITSLGDVFEQFITTEEVYYDEQGNATRRLAGWPDEASRRAGGGGTASLVDFDGTLKHDFEVGSAKIGLELGVGMKVRMAATYNITASNLFIKTLIREDFKMRGSISGKFDSDQEFEITGLPKYLSSIKFPAAAPLFQTRPLPTAFLRVKGEMGAKLEFPEVAFGAKQTIVYDTDDFPLMMSASCSMAEPDEDKEPENPLDNTEVTLYMNGSVQTGIKLTTNVETNDWIDQIFQAGIYADFYLGPQIDGQIELKSNLSELASGNMPSLYSSMKNSHLSLTLLAANVEVKGMLSFLNDKEDQTFFELNRKYLETTRYLFPDLTGTTGKYDSGSGTISGEVVATRPVLLPNTLGAGIYNAEGTCLDKSFATFAYFRDKKDSKDNRYEYSFRQPCGRYWVRPILKVMGAEIPVDDPLAERQIVVTPMLKLGNDEKRDSINVKKEEQNLEYYFDTNAKSIEVKTDYPEEDEDRSWLHAEVMDIDPDSHTGKLVVTVDENDTFWSRIGDVVLIAQTGDFIATDTLRLRQDSTLVNFRQAVAKIQWPNAKSKNHIWGTGKDGETYDYVEEREGAGTYGAPYNGPENSMEVSCTRNGNFITCTGTHTRIWDIDVPDDPTTGVSTASKHQGQGVTSLKIVLDVTKKPIKIVSGEISYNEYHTSEETNVFRPAVYNYTRIHHSTTYKGKNEVSNNISWKHEIPYIGKPTQTVYWDDETVKNEYWFVLGGPQEFSMSGESKSSLETVYKNYDVSSASNELTSIKSEINHVESTLTDNDFGEGTRIDIYLGY